MDDLLDVGVGGLVLLGVDHPHAVAEKVGACAVGDAVGVEDQHHLGLGEGTVAGQDVQEGLTGLLQAEVRHLLQGVPGEDEVVAVQDHQPSGGLLRLGLDCLGGHVGDALGLGVLPSLDGAEFPQHDGLQLLVGEGVALGEPRGAGKHRSRGLGGRAADGAADIGLQVLVGVHLLPGDHHPCAVGAEHRMRRVLLVGLGVVANGGHDLLGIVAGLVAVGDTGHAPQAAGVGYDLPHVAVEGGYGAATHQGGGLLGGGLQLLGGVAVLQIRHGPSHVHGGQLQAEPVIGLQEGTASLHESLADGAVGGLTEVAALGVLLMGAARHQHHFGVGERGTDPGTQVGLLVEVGEDESLPALVQHVLGEVGVKDQSRPGGEGLHEELYLGVVAQRLEVAYAHGAGGDLLPIQDTPLVQLAVQAVAVGYEAL